jgi:hypothetical protein
MDLVAPPSRSSCLSPRYLLLVEDSFLEAYFGLSAKYCLHTNHRWSHDIKFTLTQVYPEEWLNACFQILRSDKPELELIIVQTGFPPASWLLPY